MLKTFDIIIDTETRCGKNCWLIKVCVIEKMGEFTLERNGPLNNDKYIYSKCLILCWRPFVCDYRCRQIFSLSTLNIAICYLLVFAIVQNPSVVLSIEEQVLIKYLPFDSLHRCSGFCT